MYSLMRCSFSGWNEKERNSATGRRRKAGSKKAFQSSWGGATCHFIALNDH